MIDLRTLGGLSLTAQDGRVLRSVLAQPKRLALLFYLAAARPRGFHRRDHLLALFWPGLDEERASAALRQAIYFLRRSLGDGVVLNRGNDEVGLELGQLRCDLVELEDALDAGALEKAIELYRGELLPGFNLAEAADFDGWLDGERGRLRARLADAAKILSKRAEDRGDLEQALSWARAEVGFALEEESATRRLISLLDRSGDRMEAIGLYEALAARLQREYQSLPSPETQAVIRAIRSRDAEYTEAGSRPSSASVARGQPAREAESSIPPLSAHSRRSSMIAVVAVAAVVGLLVPAVATYRPAAPDPRRILVTPFQNQTEDPSLDLVGRLAADWIAQSLLQTGLVEVVDPASVPWRARGEPVEIFPDRVQPSLELAVQMGAGTIVRGAYYREGDSLRFQAQVVDAVDGNLTHSTGVVSGSAGEPLLAIEPLRERITAVLAATFHPRLSASAYAGSKPPSIAAYEAYLRGVELQLTGKARDAVSAFREAWNVDTTFVAPLLQGSVQAWASAQYALADSLLRVAAASRERLTVAERHQLDWMLARVRGDQNAAYRAIREAARVAPERFQYEYGYQALLVGRAGEAAEVLARFDPERHMMAHNTVGYWGAFGEALHQLGDHSDELEIIRRGQRSSPGGGYLRRREVKALAASGRVAEVATAIETQLFSANSFGSTNALLLEAAGELLAHGHTEAAVRVLDTAVEWLGSRPPADTATNEFRLLYTRMLAAAGKWHKARPAAEALVTAEPTIENRALLAVVAANAGDVALAQRLYRDVERMDEPRYAYGSKSLALAKISASLGDQAQAVSHLRNARSQGFPLWVHWHLAWELSPLWKYAPFQQIVRPTG